ncbi:hypothetical protein BJ741DRAFT_589698 [Chytriomyces cf. hyalinus JEL632]|nr:hypothetical protein BJ741DRAFT_589698 [Chytriomyces cf. hyalinus JEL632]
MGTATSRLASLPAKDNFSTSSSILGFGKRSGVADPIRPDEVLTHPAIKDAFEVLPSKRLQGRGTSSNTATVKRKRDGKLFIIKRVTKSLLPPEQWYTKPDATEKSQRIPLELVLLRSHGTDDFLPQIVDVHEDEAHYYYITQTHGIRRRKWKSIKTWLKPKYYPCDWDSYLKM